jgi:hypothetical protein
MLDPATRQILDQVETVEITTRGRTSGEPRRIEIWMYTIDGRHIITGTPGPRDWYANVMAHPHLTLHLPNGTDLIAATVPIDDPDFRNRVFTAPKTWWYRDQTSVPDLVANSPMIEMLFE